MRMHPFHFALVALALAAGCTHDQPTGSAATAAPSRTSVPPKPFEPTLDHPGSAPPPAVDPNVEHPAEHGQVTAESARPKPPPPTRSPK